MEFQEKMPDRQKQRFRFSLSQCVLFAACLVAFWQRQRIIRSAKELQAPHRVPIPLPAPHVTIILPVRNEEATIDACLASLTGQVYPDFDIMVIDDGSTDHTPEHLARWSHEDRRVQVHRVDILPAGWAGKAHALHVGVMLTRGPWLLFTDADTSHEPETLSLMMGHLLQQQDDLLSVSMNLITIAGPAMPFLMPVTEILLAQRVTPADIKGRRSHRAFAFGQYMLLKREAYLSTGGYNPSGMRSSAVEDLALAEQIKQSGRQVEIVNGRGLIKNRQWSTWSSAHQGWSKGFSSEMIRARIPLGGLPAALALVAYGLGPSGTLVSALGGRRTRRSSIFLALLTLLTQIDAKRHADRLYGLPLAWALTAPLAWTISGIMGLNAARLSLLGQSATWKDRQLPRQQRVARSRNSPPATTGDSCLQSDQHQISLPPVHFLLTMAARWRRKVLVRKPQLSAKQDRNWQNL